MSARNQVVGRLAPSPTGALHLGNARTFLLAWLQARQSAGRVVLRIEDLETPRTKPGAARQAVEDLSWLGLLWDGDPVIQTQRLPHHIAALATLRRAHLIYPCTCSRKDIERAGAAPHAGDDEPHYPGTCRDRPPPPADQPVAWRLRTPVAGLPDPITFTDQVAGPQAFHVERCIDDFVVARRGVEFQPAYQIAVVLDDASDAVTDVVRGDDLLLSAARQMVVATALRSVGMHIPLVRYWHVPLVVGPDGRRLAKRHGDSRLAHYRARGVPATRVLALLGEWIGLGPRDGLVADTSQAFIDICMQRFAWAQLPHGPIIHTPADDAWLFASR